VELSAKRLGGRGQSVNDDDTARYDQAGIQVHERLRQGFRRVAGFYPARFYILDASRSPEEVLTDACQELERRWNL
jgi:thymidylate kinase